MKVVVRISDGLGNQLFQYSLGKYVADILGCDLFFDKTHFLFSTTRLFQLDNYSEPSRVRRWGVIREYVFILLWAVKSKIGRKRFAGILKFFGITWLPIENPFALQSEFDESVVRSLRGTIYISGCYGHIPHMPDRESLRSSLGFRRPPKERTKELIDMMRSTESVSVHIRRTDYLYLSNNAPALDLLYQRNAMNMMLRKTTLPRWFVFSDDIEWCRENLKDVDGVVFVSGNEDEPWEDMRLMSACKHHIIANSTFSWRGAFLGKGIGLTIYPIPWFPGLAIPQTCVPETWIGVSSGRYVESVSDNPRT